MNGYGTFWEHDGTVRHSGHFFQDMFYTGDVKNGRMHGKGRLDRGSSTAYYEGEFKDDKRHGQGISVDLPFTIPGTLYCYKGAWVDDNREGFGSWAVNFDEPGIPVVYTGMWH